MKQQFPALAKRSLALALALALLLSLCPTLPLTAKAVDFIDGWAPTGSYTWVKGAFTTADDDLVYEGNQPYDWTFTLQQDKTTVNLQLAATITDANGETVSTYEGTRPCNKSSDPTVMLSFEDFPELTTELAGEFTLTCDVYYNGSPAGQMVQSFSRVAGSEPEETTEATTEATTEETTEATESEGGEEELVTGWTPTDKYSWIVDAFTPDDAGLAYEGDEPYDWQFTLQQVRVTVTLNVSAVITDAEGNVVAQFNGTKTANKSSDPSVILSAADFADLSVNKNGEFTLTCDVAYGSDPVGKLVKTFSRTGATDEGEEPENPEEPETPEEPEIGSVDSAYAYIDALESKIVAENMTVGGIDYRNGGFSAEWKVPVFVQGALGAWNIRDTTAVAFTLSEAFLKDFDGNAIITVEYVDASTGIAELVYHGKESTTAVNETAFQTNGANNLKIHTVTYELTDAVFTNAYDVGYSFAINVPTTDPTGRIYVKSVKVEKPSGEQETAYSVALNSEVADQKFYDETPFDLNLVAGTTGANEVVTVNYTLTGGNDVNITDAKSLLLTAEGVNVLDAEWFATNAIGFGEFTLAVTMTKAGEEGEEPIVLAQETFNFSRVMTSILASELRSETAENKDGILVFAEDAAMDLQLFLKNKLAETFSGILTYTVSKNGTPLEGYNGLTLAVEDLSGEAAKIEGAILPNAAEYGIYELAISVTTAEGEEVHEKTFIFARVKTEFLSASVSSATAGETLVFVDEAPYDLKLSLQKADGNAEKLSIEYTVLNGETVVKTGSTAVDVPAVSATEIDLTSTLADVAGLGNFTLKLTATNALGYKQDVEFNFSRIESIKVELTGGNELQFVGDEAYDLKLNLLKQAGEDGTYTVNYTVTKGDAEVKSGSIENVSVTETAAALDLDMTGVEGNGTYVVTVTLVDGEGNTVKTGSFKVTRVSDVKVQLNYPSALKEKNENEELVFVNPITYIDLVPYDFSVSLKKDSGDAEDVTVTYAVTANGDAIASNTTTVSVGSVEATDVPLDLSAVKEYGEYVLNVVVLDAEGNQITAIEEPFVRWDTITSQLTSETNPDLVFTESKDKYDMVIKVWDALAGKDLSVTLTASGGTLTSPLSKTVPIKAGSASAPLTSSSIFGSGLANHNGVGTYTLRMTITDSQGRAREDVTYTFHRVAKEGSVDSAIKSESSENLVFVSGGNNDMTLYIEKLDNVKEGFAATLTVTDKDGNEVAKKEAPLDPFVSFKMPIAELVDLSAIAAGTYNINLTLTDNSGVVRHTKSTQFTMLALEGSVDFAVTSASNSDLIFTEGEELDLKLNLAKNDGYAEAFKALITITTTDGIEILPAKEVKVPAQTDLEKPIQASVGSLVDLTKLPATGSFVLNVVLTDAAGNERLTSNTEFHRVKVASVKTQVSSNTNKDMIFVDGDALDLMMYVQKTDGITESLHVKYTVYAPDGTELVTEEDDATVHSGTNYLKQPIALTEAPAYGIYKVNLVVTDNSGIVRSNTDTRFVRIDGYGIKHQVSGSATGTKMQFTPGMELDLCLFAQKTDGIPESVQASLSVTSPSGAVIYTISGNLNIKAAPGVFKFALPLAGKCNEFGTYKVYYTFHDDAGNLRVENTAYFKIINPSGDIRVALQSASGKFPGLIYGKDDAFDLTLYLQMADGADQTVQLRYTIYDMNGLVLETKQGRADVPASSYRKLPIELPDIEAFEKYGIFSMKVEVADQNGKMLFTESYPFTRVLTPETQLDIMGVCTHLSKRGMSVKQSQQYVDLARSAGISFWRDELPWSTVEPAKGQYRIPESADAAVDYTLSIGLEPLFILDYGNTNYGSDVTTDEWLQGYLGYVEYLVTHFKGRIKYYEVWNEWNIGLGGMDKKYRDMADVYAKLLVETYKVIKAIDPEITVIGGVVAGGEEKWIEKMLQYPDVLNYMDVFSFHEYPDNDVNELVEQTEKVRELMTKYGRPDIPLWVTETGWPTHIGRGSFTEEASAGNLVSLYTWAMANPGVLDQIFWYDLHNDGTERENGEYNFGLLRNWSADTESVPLAAKPSYVALCAMNAILGDAEFVDAYDMGHKKITAYHFKKDGKDLLVAWADDCALNMVATVGNNNIVVTDMYGNASALNPVDGKVSLFFSDAPIYIEYDLSQKLELVEGGFKLDQEQYSATPGAVFPVKITRNNGLETQSGSYVFSMPESWSVESIEFGAAAAGATEITDTVYVTVGDDAAKGEMTITARVVIGGNVVGQFNVPIEMGDICTVNPDVVFTENGAEFKLSVQVLNENSTKPLSGTINLLAPEKLIGEASSIPFEIPAGENKAILIDVPADVANNFYNVKIEVVLGSGAKHEVTKPMSFLYAIEAPKDMKLDGVIDDQWKDAMEFTIGEEDWFNDVSSDAEWPGNTAKGYAMWDDQYLYVAVEAHDASHYQVGTGASIWMGDSIQMTTDISRFTVPAYHGYNEIGFSLNSESGVIENWNWYASPGKNVSAGGIFKIVRDEAASTTTYEVALPWSELLPTGVEFDFRSIGFALIVNENSIVDGEPTGRVGWIEYMCGIGYRKDPMQFGDLILVKRSEIQ